MFQDDLAVCGQILLQHFDEISTLGLDVLPLDFGFVPFDFAEIRRDLGHLLDRHPAVGLVRVHNQIALIRADGAVAGDA
jgi:hypothetical protein